MLKLVLIIVWSKILINEEIALYHKSEFINKTLNLH